MLGHSMQTTERDSSEALSPLLVRDLRAALEASWDVLATVQSPSATESRREETRELLARRLLKCAASGETNKNRLVTYAIGSIV
jgi:hypothetical protein